MREIKFRAWDKSCDKMYCSDAYDRLKDFFRHYEFIKSKYPDLVELMQYTGLKDKNGVEIYEGDIVEIEMTRSFVVCWNTAAGFRFNSYMPNGLIDNLWEASKIGEVIGNVYENSELLKC